MVLPMKPLLPYIMEQDEILLALSWSAVIKQSLLGGVIVEYVKGLTVAPDAMASLSNDHLTTLCPYLAWPAIVKRWVSCS